MQTAASETESRSLDLIICVHHYTLRAPCLKGQGNRPLRSLRGQYGTTAVLPKIPHSNCWKRVPNRPLRPCRQSPIWNTFGTVAEREFWENGCFWQQLEAVCDRPVLMSCSEARQGQTRPLRPLFIDSSVQASRHLHTGCPTRWR